MHWRKRLRLPFPRRRRKAGKAPFEKEEPSRPWFLLRISYFADSELCHARHERGGPDAEQRGGPVAAVYFAVAPAQSVADVAFFKEEHCLPGQHCVRALPCSERPEGGRIGLKLRKRRSTELPLR